MERTGGRDGVALRPNNSLASVPGPATLVSGGNGSGLRIPLSCAFAVPYTHVRTAHKVSAAFVTASGATLMTPDPGAPLGPYQPGRPCGGFVPFFDLVFFAPAAGVVTACSAESGGTSGPLLAIDSLSDPAPGWLMACGSILLASS